VRLRRERSGRRVDDPPRAREPPRPAEADEVEVDELDEVGALPLAGPEASEDAADAAEEDADAVVMVTPW
jgi:hypothetical protein